MKCCVQNFLFYWLIFFTSASIAQRDSLSKDWSYHFQFTGIQQGHTSFHALYSGQNSLKNSSEKALSVTSTLFLGRKLWKGASLFFNPEIAGGSGISQARGIAGFTNGETFRIGDPAPALYNARLFFRQIITLKSSVSQFQDDDANELAGYLPSSRIEILAGKFAMSDYFDNNDYAHDPRSEFLNWALMSNAAWDYPANTRGYTDIILINLIKPSWQLRAATALEPAFANGPDLDYNYFKANAITIEFQKNYNIYDHPGTVRLLAFRNTSKAPAYNKVINDYETGTDTSLNVINGTSYGGIKYGFGVNVRQEITKNVGSFLKLSWNDGKTATWAFTEIDESISAGLSLKGNSWKRKDDVAGVAFVANGISKNHRNFLNIGGYGFIIGDGRLTHYGLESITEVYYNLKLFSSLWVTGDYQFVNNPAYNKDRGPVDVVALRVHVEI